MPKVIKNPDEILECFHQFQLIWEKTDGNYTYDNFQRFYNWYFFPNEQAFAPSKFLGYVGTTIDNYIGAGDGGETKDALSEYFDELDKNSEEYKELYDELKVFSFELGKNISGRINNPDGGIYIPKNEYESNFGKYSKNNDSEQIPKSNETETERRQLALSRIGQGLFRSRVINNDKKCVVTGITNISLLIASHIKSWKESSNEERLDGENGILLSPHIDKLFDRHLISFSDSGELICYSTEIKKVLSKWKIDLNINYCDFSIKRKEYLKYHRSKCESGHFA